MPEVLAASAKNKVGPLDPAHAHDWSILHLGHTTASRKVIHLVDLDVTVWGLDEVNAAGGSLPVAIILLSHGWANKARDMEPTATGLIGEAHRLDSIGDGRHRVRDVLVATFDQRNHGERRRIKGMPSFQKDPRQFGIDMATAVVGGMQDHALCMQFLPGRLFPHGERVVDKWISVGFSMGGHVGWRLVREDPRLEICVPICSSPSETLGNLLLAESLPSGAPETPMPPDVGTWYKSQPAAGTYSKKKILAISGGLDAMMPTPGAEPRLQAILAEAIVGERYIQPGRGHVLSEEMVKRAAEFVWRQALTE